MYGLVNRAIQEFVTSAYGTETWESIRSAADVQPSDFHGMEEYPDELTYALVEAASRPIVTAGDFAL